MTLYQKLQTFTQGQQTGKAKQQPEVVFGRKKSNYCYKRSYLNGSREVIKSKRKYNSVNVAPGDLSTEQTKSFSKVKGRRGKNAKNGTSLMEKKLKVIVGPLNPKVSQSRKKRASKRAHMNSKGGKQTGSHSQKQKTTDRNPKRKSRSDESEERNRSKDKSRSPLTHLNVIRKYIQLEKKFGIKSKSIEVGKKERLRSQLKDTNDSKGSNVAYSEDKIRYFFMDENRPHQSEFLKTLIEKSHRKKGSAMKNIYASMNKRRADSQTKGEKSQKKQKKFIVLRESTESKEDLPESRRSPHASQFSVPNHQLEIKSKRKKGEP